MAQLKARRFLVVTAVAAVCGLFVWAGLRGYEVFDPPDRVRIFVNNIPVGVDFLSLVASTDEGVVNLDWSPRSEIGTPFTMHPAQCIWSYQDDPANPKVDWDAHIRWHHGRRYGVVMRGTDGTWRVVWFAADKVPLRGNRWLLGGGSAEFDLLGKQAEPLTPDELKQLALEDALQGL